MIWQPAFCKICAWLIYETNKPGEFVPSAHLWHQPPESCSHLPLIWWCMFFAWCHRLRKQTLVPAPQIFQEEYSIFFLNQGGSLVAIRHTPLPIRHIWWGPSLLRSAPPLRLLSLTSSLFVARLSVTQPLFFPPRLSFDEGRNWDKYSFTSSPLYVDGVLGEPGEDILIMT